MSPGYPDRFLGHCTCLHFLWSCRGDHVLGSVFCQQDTCTCLDVRGMDHRKWSRLHLAPQVMSPVAAFEGRILGWADVGKTSRHAAHCWIQLLGVSDYKSCVCLFSSLAVWYVIGGLTMKYCECLLCPGLGGGFLDFFFFFPVSVSVFLCVKNRHPHWEIYNRTASNDFCGSTDYFSQSSVGLWGILNPLYYWSARSRGDVRRMEYLCVCRYKFTRFI